MKTWILAAATLLLVNGVDARERRGPPSACPQPKVDCCEKPKCEPKKCEPAKCKPKPCQPACKPVCNPDPCCPPVCFEKGFPTDPCCTPSAYSEAADIDTRCGWDTLITANFIYWDVQQEGMLVAVPFQGTTTAGNFAQGGATVSAVGLSALNQATEYTPGFQVGLGWSGPKDNWVVYAEYTWLHGSTTTVSDAPGPNVTTLNGTTVPQTGVWNTIPWHGNQGNPNATHISSTWKYKIDLIDAQVSRPFYSGTRLILEPFFGLRGALIRQQFNLTTTNLAGSTVNGAEIVTHHNSRGIAIGPRAGLNGDWHFGYGIRFIGNAGVSALYTAFDARRNAPSAVLGSLPEIVKLDDYNVIRPSLDMSLGLGWGSYFNCRRWHVDLAATYDFNVFWGQNMMRFLADEVFARSGASAGDLFLQGLTIQTRFDF